MTIIIIVALILSFIVASQGESREIGFGASLFISLFFTPLIGILVVLASDKKKPRVRKGISGEVKEIYDSAIQNYKKREYSIAINKLKETNGIQPNKPIILIGLAHNYACIDNHNEAIDYIERANECGYSNFKRIQTHPDFSELRNKEIF